MLRARLLIIACWGAATIAFVAAILPQRDAPHLGSSDKVDHIIAFLTIALLARLAYPRRPAVLLFAAIAVFGGLIEVTQSVPALHRDAEWRDWIADMGATLIGLALATPLLGIFNGEAAKSTTMPTNGAG